MLFTFISSFQQIPQGATRQAFLVADNWDDWFKFQTTFMLYVKDELGTLHEPGNVKIGKIGLLPGAVVSENTRRTEVPQQFDELGPEYFSLGQSENFYETLNELNADFKRDLLVGLRDCAYDLTIFELAAGQAVMGDSLLRTMDSTSVRLRLNRLANGNVILTRFTFDYVLPTAGANLVSPRLAFSVRPHSAPPSNVHVLIGRNGVGKTRCMQGIARAVLNAGADPSAGTLQISDTEPWAFSGLVLVAFSAFDTFELPAELPSGIRATVVGLRASVPGTNDVRTKTPAELAGDFLDSLRNCRRGLKAQRWLSAVASLSTDPLFAEADAAALLSPTLLDDVAWDDQATRFFRRLSSGHAIVLLTLTRLVDLVEEKTLVLLDEPEGHLHPPLLSAFIRTLADLLTNRNGVGIIATHSPVVLQEVPNSCAWILNRSGLVTTSERPTVETFGENVGTLTREVFGFEVTNTGFHQLLRNTVEQQQLDYDSVLSHFSGNLGMEARAIARSLVAERDSRGVQ